MRREPTERCLARRTARAMRAAALRLAREWAAEDADPAQTYGCVDWYRYDVAATSREENAAPRRAAGPSGGLSAH